MSNELKDCPFCGSEAKLYADSKIYPHVVCSSKACKACGPAPAVHERLTKAAIESWNTRAGFQQNDGSVTDELEARLKVALERAGAAESLLRNLADECENDYTAGWEERMATCIDGANQFLSDPSWEPAASDEMVYAALLAFKQTMTTNGAVYSADVPFSAMESAIKAALGAKS